MPGILMQEKNLDAEVAWRGDNVKRKGEDAHLHAKEKALEQILPSEVKEIIPSSTLILDFWLSEL